MLKIFLFLIFCAFPFGVSFSQEHQKPTTVFGEAQTPEGTERVFILHQSNNDNNPLGNPIVASQENVDNQKEANQTAQTIDTYLLCAGIKTDIVNSYLKTRYSIEREIKEKRENQ